MQELTSQPSLTSCQIVAGLVGSFFGKDYFHNNGHQHGNWWSSDSGSNGRLIYSEVIAGISIILSIVWLLPFAGGFIHYPVDIILMAAWFAVFGVLISDGNQHSKSASDLLLE